MCRAAHLHVQLQDVGVGPQQLTQVGFGAAEVSVDELFDVTVGRRSGAQNIQHQSDTCHKDTFKTFKCRFKMNYTVI